MKHLTKRLAPIALLTSFTLASQGCIIWDAYDQVELANQQLGEINSNLVDIDNNLGKIDAKLASIDENLDSVDNRLGELQVTLDAVSVSLESLRKTINNIDSTIPFLSLSGDDEETKQELEEGGEDESETDIDSDPTLVPDENDEG